MNTRDRAGEILEVKERNPRRHRFGSYNLQNLKKQWTNARTEKACTPDFYIIRAVTLLEVFIRGNVAELTDHGTEYAKRAVEFAKLSKMEFGLVEGIQGRVITLGDIVGHNIPVNSFSQILACFEALLDKPVRPLLAAAVDRWATELKKEPATPIIADFDALARSLTRLFEVRHIICHETPGKSAYEAKEIDDFLDFAIQFTKTLEEVLTFERFGLVPLTQVAMSIDAHDRLKRKEDELKELFSRVRERVKDTDENIVRRIAQTTDSNWTQCLDDTQEKWFSYRNSQCEFETYLSRGGTIRPVLWAGEAMRLTEIRIGELSAWLKQDSEK
jgi:uncharacterized protein YecT (DUF1311 family)